MSPTVALGIALLSSLQPCLAMPWIGPMETPMGLMASVGISPLPTEAPGLNGIPKELKPRQNALIYPPPNNWCGLIGGLTENILSCETSLSCVLDNTASAAGCCPATDGPCTGIRTTCYGYNETCTGACESDISILKCSNTMLPYCGTYSFDGTTGGTFLYNCQATDMFVASSVEFLPDYYLTAIGSTLTTASDSLASETAGSATAANTGSTVRPQSSSFTTGTSDASTGLAAAAIGGIAAGIGLLVCFVLGLVIFFCLRSRKRKRLAASQNISQNMAGHAPPTYQPPPMMQQHQQQQQQQQTGHHPIPHQDNQFQGSPNDQPTQSGYFGGPTDPVKDSAFTHVSPIGSPSPNNMTPRPFSAISSQHSGEQRLGTLSPPVPVGLAQDHYKTPNSSTTIEVDGTQGNPGVPLGQQPARMEVDGTQGNPGVPHDQHHYQGPYEIR